MVLFHNFKNVDNSLKMWKKLNYQKNVVFDFHFTLLANAMVSTYNDAWNRSFT